MLPVWKCCYCFSTNLDANARTRCPVCSHFRCPTCDPPASSTQENPKALEYHLLQFGEYENRCMGYALRPGRLDQPLELTSSIMSITSTTYNVLVIPQWLGEDSKLQGSASIFVNGKIRYTSKDLWAALQSLLESERPERTENLWIPTVWFSEPWHDTLSIDGAALDQIYLLMTRRINANAQKIFLWNDNSIAHFITSNEINDDGRGGSEINPVRGRNFSLRASLQSSSLDIDNHRDTMLQKLLNEYREKVFEVDSSWNLKPLTALQSGCQPRRTSPTPERCHVIEVDRDVSAASTHSNQQTRASLNRTIFSNLYFKLSRKFTTFQARSKCEQLHVAYIFCGLASMITAICYTVWKSDAGGGFTIGAYIIALGTAIVMLMQVRHNKRCTCDQTVAEEIELNST